MFKKLLVFSVLGFISLPAPLAYASAVTDNSIAEIVDNVTNAESIDFSVDLDVETSNQDLEQPVKFHLDLDGETDFESQSAFDLNFWSSDQNNEFDQAGGSVIFTTSKIYFSESGEEWFYVELGDELESLADENDNDQNTEAIESFLQEALDRGVIEYDLETVDVISRKLAWRYAYTVNTDRLIESLLDQEEITQVQADKMSDSLDHVTITGKFWVDATEMLPVMLTVDVNSNTDAETYTNIKLSVLFNSFNQEVEINEPTDALSFDEYRSSSIENLVISSLDNTASNMDTDGDGLSDNEELTVWETNPLSTDSDGDSYPDQTEVLNGYDPNGPGRLN